jgi:hypothetical protein
MLCKRKSLASHLVDEFVVEVRHFQFDQTSGCLLDVSAAQVLFEQHYDLLHQVLHRTDTAADSPNVVQSVKELNIK